MKISPLLEPSNRKENFALIESQNQIGNESGSKMDQEFKMDQALFSPWIRESCEKLSQKRFGYYVKKGYLRRHFLLLFNCTHTGERKMFTFMLNWEDAETGELSGAEIYIDDNGDWRGYSNRNLVYYIWEQDVFCFDEITEGPKRAQSVGIFSHMERL